MRITRMQYFDAVDEHICLALFPIVFTGQTVVPGQVSGYAVRMGQHVAVV